MLARPISRRELLLAALGAVGLALIVHWPLLVHFGSDVPRDLGDPLAQAWQVAWGGHALLNQPLDFFQSNQFWPRRNTLAYSDALIGYSPFGMIGSGPQAAIARYDALFLFAYALCFLSAYLLARELGLDRAPAVLAGVAFAYAPYRLEQQGHLHIVSSGGIPLALFLLLRGHLRARPLLIVAGWLVVTWQLALGFSLGLLLAYLIASAAVVGAVVWWRGDRRKPAPPVVRANAVGVAILAVAAYVLTRPYAAVLDELPEARRTLGDVASFSPRVFSYLAAPEESTVWGAVTAPAREALSFPIEQSLFPGLTVVALAATGLLWRRGAFSRRLRIWLAVAILVCVVLSLGASTEGIKRFSPYRAMYEVAPGFSAIRVPGRIMTLTSLGLAVLAGAGAQRAGAWIGRSRGPKAASATVLALAAVVLAEGSSFRTGDSDPGAFRTPRVETAPGGFADLRAPVLVLPADPQANRRYLLWSTAGFPALLNGRSSVTPRSFTETVEAVEPFPDAASVLRLRTLGVRSVALHLQYVPGTPWRRWARRSIAGLGITRTVRGELVVYDLGRARP